MNVVYLNPSPQLGGAERSLLDVLRGVRAAEPDWTLHLLVSGDGPLVARAEALGVRTTVVPFPAALARLGDAGVGGPAGSPVPRRSLLARGLRAAPATAAYTRTLRRAIAGLAPDVVHANGFKMHVLATLACAPDVPVVWHVHDHVSERPVMARLLRSRAHRCATIVANSHSTARDARSVCGPDVPVVPIYNAVDLATFSPSGPVADLDALAGLAPALTATVRIGMLATFARWKGHEVFLKSLATLSRELPVRGYVIGGAVYETDGSQYSAADLRATIHALGLESHVGLTGYLDDPATAMRALDVVVHASTRPEPFGLVIAEGMACGRAVVVSAAGGAAELVMPGVDALTHRPGDVTALTECLRTLVADRGLRERLGTAARATVQRRFDRTRLGAEFSAVYRRSLTAATVS